MFHSKVSLSSSKTSLSVWNCPKFSSKHLWLKSSRIMLLNWLHLQLMHRCDEWIIAGRCKHHSIQNNKENRDTGWTASVHSAKYFICFDSAIFNLFWFCFSWHPADPQTIAFKCVQELIRLQQDRRTRGAVRAPISLFQAEQKYKVDKSYFYEVHRSGADSTDSPIVASGWCIFFLQGFIFLWLQSISSKHSIFFFGPFLD